MEMKSLIKEVKKEEETLYKISFAIGWLKGEKETSDKKQFSASDVLELLETIKNN